MRVLHVGVSDWLVLDEEIWPRFLIHHGAALYRPTGETLMVYRVDFFVLERERRWALGWFQTLAEAQKACEGELGRPDFSRPVIGPDGGVVTQAEQKRRWEAGLDVRTGEPLKRPAR